MKLMPRSTLIVFLACLFASQQAAAQDDSATPEDSEYVTALRALNWQLGPDNGNIVDRATIAIPEDYGFLNLADTDKFLELNENLASGTEQLFQPLDFSYSAYFSFDESGYVKDDDTLDANAILQSITESTEAANVEKRNRGWATLQVTGWHTMPHYDSDTKRLEWALVLEGNDGTQTINHNTRFLGRKGVMQVTLVSSPDLIDGAIADFNQRAKDFSFNSS